MSDLTTESIQSSEPEFLNSDLKGSILAAAGSQRSLLCFLTDDSSESKAWESLLRDQSSYPRLSQSIAVRIEADTQESQYLNNIVPSASVPSIVIIQNGQIKHTYQSSQTTLSQLKLNLDSLFGPNNDNKPPKSVAHIVLPSSSGRMRLPNNAYDALVTQTQKWVDQKIKGENILRLQLRLLKNVPELQDVVKAIESRATTSTPTLPQDAENKLLNLSASALHSKSTSHTPSDSGPSIANQSSTIPQSSARGSSVNVVQPASAGIRSAQPQQQAQRNEYIRLQREREATEKAEKERVKTTIQAQQEERRQQEKLRKANELAALRERNSTTAEPSSTDIRLQVRAFDGHAMTTSFPRSATIAKDVRPWVDEVAKQSVPYNLKIMLAPTRNRDIQAGEEKQALGDLGIVGSATMIMVPVKFYVESYNNRGSGIIPIVTGAAGSVVGTINWLFGWDRVPRQANSGPIQSREGSPVRRQASPIPRPGSPRIRTLADQRADEESKMGHELYNGNQLNFQGKKPDDPKNE